MSLSFRVANLYLESAMKPFDSSRVLEIKRDVDIFLSNSDRINTEEQHDTFSTGVKTWMKSFRKDMQALMQYLYGKALEELGTEAAAERQMNSWRKKLEPLWGIISSLYLPEWKYWSTERMTRIRWKEILESKSQRLPAVAKFLDGLRKRRSIRPEISTIEEQRMSLEGFQVMLVGFEEEYQESFDLFLAALKEYRSRAAKRLPDLLRRSLPFILRFDVAPTVGGELGSYGEQALDIYPRNAYRMEGMVRTLAHEMGHHLYGLLGSKGQSFWRAAINGDLGDINLRNLLKSWPSGSSLYGWMASERTKDPVLALQLESLMTTTNPKIPKEIRKNWETMDDREGIEAYLEAGGDPVIRLPKTPISGYATTNPEEAFSEVVANLVTFGERTLSPKILSWFQSLV